MKPWPGNSSPFGGVNLNSSPVGVLIESVIGLKFESPEYIIAVTISGEVKKFIVFLLPSFLALKFLLKEVQIELVSLDFLSISTRSHWPIHGPQALAKTIAPFEVNVSIKPSLSIVALICSEPGVTKNGIFGFKPAFSACLTNETALDISW